MKYIIDIEEKPLCVFYKDTQTYFPRLWRVKGFNSLVFDEEVLSRLEELNSDYINEHYGQLQDDAYQRGLEDGKAVRVKGCEGCKWEGDPNTYSPCERCCNCYKNEWTAKDDKIEVGDEVRLCRHKVPYIVTSCDGDDDTYILMTVNGGFIKAEKYNVRKTGRHFDIALILEAMKE